MEFVLQIVIFFLSCYGSLSDTNWTKCVPDANSDVFFVHEMVVSPVVVQLPGLYNISFDGVAAREIEKLVIDVQIGLQNASTAEVERVYPVETEFIRVYDGCFLIDKLLFASPERIKDHIDIQIDKLYTQALHYHAGCPLLKGRVAFRDQPLLLPFDLVQLNLLPKIVDRHIKNAYYRHYVG